MLSDMDELFANLGELFANLAELFADLGELFANLTELFVSLAKFFAWTKGPCPGPGFEPTAQSPGPAPGLWPRILSNRVVCTSAMPPMPAFIHKMIESRGRHINDIIHSQDE